MRKSPQKVEVLKIKPGFTHVESFQNGLKFKRYILFILTLYDLNKMSVLFVCFVLFKCTDRSSNSKSAINLETLKLSLIRKFERSSNRSSILYNKSVWFSILFPFPSNVCGYSMISCKIFFLSNCCFCLMMSK